MMITFGKPAVRGLFLLTLLILSLSQQVSLPALAADKDWMALHVIEDDFATAAEFLRSSIEEEGLAIANEGNVADMMSRTKDAIENAETVFANARIYQFCSAKLGHRLFAVLPSALAACPLTIFIYELKGSAGKIHIGYRRPPRTGNAEADKIFIEVETMLARIVRRAVE